MHASTKTLTRRLVRGGGVQVDDMLTVTPCCGFLAVHREFTAELTCFYLGVGYKTKSILCMPIYNAAREVVGVAQLVNKRSGPFTKRDEKLFETFAIFCGLGLHASYMYDQVQKNATRSKVRYSMRTMLCASYLTLPFFTLAPCTHTPGRIGGALLPQPRVSRGDG